MKLCLALFKSFLFILNLIFMLLSIVLIYYTASDLASSPQFSTMRLYISVALAIGVVMATVSTCAVLGVLLGNAWLLGIHVKLLSATVVVQLVAFVVAFVWRHHWLNVLGDQMSSEIKHYGQPQHQRSTRNWDAVQIQFDCCGVYNYTEWQSWSSDAVPDSCCIDSVPGCGLISNYATHISKHIYTQGCMSVFAQYITAQASAIIGVAAVVIAVQVLVVMLGCYTVHALRKINYKSSTITM